MNDSPVQWLNFSLICQAKEPRERQCGEAESEAEGVRAFIQDKNL
ncbi:TPA: hypothetical protein ACIPUI_002359 [Citrobacter freundii]